MNKRRSWKSWGGWAVAFFLLALYVFTLYQRGNSWRFAPDLKIVVLSEPLASITRQITDNLAEVHMLSYPLSGTGEILRAQQELQDAHIFLVPREEDISILGGMDSSARVISTQAAFPSSFQYPLLQNNRQFFTYASGDLEEKMVTEIRDKLVDIDVVRAGKYEVATKRLRDRIKKDGSLGFETVFRLP